MKTRVAPWSTAVAARCVFGGDVKTRQRLLTEAERILIADYPLVPLYFFVNKHLVSRRIRGFEPNALDRHPSRFLVLRER